MLDWLSKSATDLGRGIGNGSIDPVALTQAFLGAIESHDQRGVIYSVVAPDRAMAEAEAAADRARAGQRRSLLDGVPISWKDLFDSAGVGTEAGSALLKGRVPATDARVLQTATSMGLVCLGKTHMSELAFSGLGYNPMTATPQCINDPNAVPGGSSSGAAASVAFNLAAAGIGSDTGGSVRIPSAWNDLVGLKTTSGRLSIEGVVPLCESFDTVGPLCRNIDDAAALLSILEGRAAPDLRGTSMKGVRLAQINTVGMEDLRDAPRAGYVSARERLQAAGATVEAVEAPELAEAMALTGVLFTGEAYGQWRDVIEANPHLMYEEILERFRAGMGFSAPDFAAAWKTLEKCRAKWNARMAGYDAVICPTSAILPPNLKRLAEDHDYYVAENLLALRNTRIGNLMGLSSLTLPTGVPSCGIMFFGAPMKEDRLLRLGKAAEDALA